uniref:Uncharacterized protein n=1 Tax=uncultured Armatimonadetes bacterium TaxID=157466 RepID=A0A6J4HYM6_9BACT|nr:hypothetical protein AVDCRST_MAG63-1159 [uncultured Armatimonadetes bacterium]
MAAPPEPGRPAAEFAPAPVDASAPRYAMTLLKTDAAVGINDRGEVVCGTGGEALLWYRGKVRRLVPPLEYPQASLTPEAINNQGQVVGSGVESYQGAYTTFEEFHFWWEGGRTRVGKGPRIDKAANRRGQRVGSAAIGPEYTHDTMDPESHETTTTTARGPRALLWGPNGARELGTLGGTYSEAHALNDRGQAVGEAATPSEAEHAVLWQRGKIYDLNALVVDRKGVVLQTAHDINNAGQIVGETASGQAFLLTPVPAGRRRAPGR